MKKSFFTLTLIAFCAYGAVAQVEQGKILASGSLAFSSSSYKSQYDGNTMYDFNTTTVQLSPRLGFFITDAVAVGAGLGFATSTLKNENSKGTETSVSLSPFVRYYLPQGAFGQAEVGIGSSKLKGEGEQKTNDFLWSLGVGYAYFLNDNVAIEPMVSYNAATNTDADDTKYKQKTNTISLAVGLSIYLGR